MMIPVTKDMLIAKFRAKEAECDAHNLKELENFVIRSDEKHAKSRIKRRDSLIKKLQR